MGRPPAHGAPSFRFHASEVAEMETILREHAGQVPHRDLLVSLATKFSNSPDRAGKTIVQMKQVWNWFQNRRYALRAKLVKSPGNPIVPSNPQGEGPSIRNVPPVLHQQAPVPLGHNLVRNASENPPMEFEAKSARDGAWYDVQEFLSHRNFEADNPEVLVRFAGFGQEEDEWVNVLKHVRHRSLPCESTECLIVIPGDLILCFQEGKEQALYFDAHVLDAQRRRHDVRGCRCRFLVRYDHDQSEEIVPLRKICRRPDTDYRLQLLSSANESAAAASPVVADSKRPPVDPASSSSLRVPNPSTSPVAFPSHTIVNPLAGVPHSALSPATALTSAPAPAPAPVLITTPSQSLTSISAPAPAPAPALITTPSQSLTSGSAPAPVPAPVLAPTPAQPQPPAPAPALAPPEAPAPFMAAAPSQTPSRTQTPALAPAQVPALATHGAPASASSLTPMAAPTPSSIVVSAPTPSTPIPSPDPTLTAIPAPSLIPAVISGSTLVTAPAPSPTQILVPTPTTILTPSESLNITGNTESDIPATSSAGEASTREIITNPSVANMVMEDKKEEISIPGTSTVVTGGSSVLQGETSENRAVTVISPEKVDSIIAPSEPANFIAAPMEGGPGVSTMAESSNVLSMSIDDTKEGKAENC